MRQDRPATKKLEPRSHCDKSNSYAAVTPLPPCTHPHTRPPTSPRAQICSGKPHTFSTCRLNQLVTVIEAIAHYLGSNIFVFILFYNLYLAHYTPTFFALNASFGQWRQHADRMEIACMLPVLPFADNGCLGFDEATGFIFVSHAQQNFFLKDNIGASLFVSVRLRWGETFRRANIFKVKRWTGTKKGGDAWGT